MRKREMTNTDIRNWLERQRAKRERAERSCHKRGWLIVIAWAIWLAGSIGLAYWLTS